VHLDHHRSNVIKVQLKRHPSSSNLKQYFCEHIEIEPHALVLSIEKFLIVRDYGRVRRDDFDDLDGNLLESRNMVKL
jgi:hypothetical protein